MKQTTLITLLALCVAPFARGQTIIYQGVEIHPGDVLNFQGGFFTADQRYLTYGHSALYLGMNPEKGQRSFLDFTATEEHWGGSSKQEQRAFLGRILPEKEFLEANGKSHVSFDVFRLRDVSTLNQEKMLQAAKEIAVPSNRWGIEYICSSAIATVLARATGHTDIIAETPDDLTTGLFIRHPQLTGKSINIQAAPHEIQANELDRATREASTDFLSALPSEAVDSRDSVQAGWTDYENWLIRMDAIVSRMEADERRDQEQRNFNRELMVRASSFGYLVAAAGILRPLPT